MEKSWFDIINERLKDYKGYNDVDPIINYVKDKYKLKLFTMQQDYPIRMLCTEHENPYNIYVRQSENGISKVVVSREGEDSDGYEIPTVNFEAFEEIVKKYLNIK